MPKAGTNPLAALGAHVAGFSTALSHAPAAEVIVGDQRGELTERGRVLLARLLDAEPSTVAQVETLLEGGHDLISPEEAAALLGVSRPTVVRWAAAGELTDHPVGAHHRFSRADVLELRARRAQQAAENRAAARQARQQAEGAGNLDVPPTPAELVAAGQALRDGKATAAAGVLARARRAGARRSADAAGS